jgi:hypothetical protein
MEPYLILVQNAKDEWETHRFWSYVRFMENVRFMLTNPKDYKNVATYRISQEIMT